MRTLCVLLALLVSACVGAAHEPPSPSPTPPRVADVSERASALPAILDGLELPPVRPSARPKVRQPSPSVVTVVVGGDGARPPVGAATGSHRVRGAASWYDDGDGLYAAAGPALRVGDWRSRHVRACAGGRCVTVVLSDWCQCYRNESSERIIDLSPDAFSRLAPLSRGVVKVTVEWP